jgi:hypothetical protein
MTARPTDLSIDEYLRERLMPVEGSIPGISGIEMYGNSVPVESVRRGSVRIHKFPHARISLMERGLGDSAWTNTVRNKSIALLTDR